MTGPGTGRRRPAAATGVDGAVKSADRALEIVELLTRVEHPMTFLELQHQLGYPHSSLHGLVGTLLARGWLEMDSSTRRYWLGIRTWEAGATYLRAVDLAERARPYLDQVRDAVEETTQLSVLDGRYNVYIAKVDGPHQLALQSAVGRRLEAHATGLGKVLLAGLPEPELLRRFSGITLERFTPTTITDLTRLRHELRQIEERGYGTDEEEYTVGVRCVAAPIRDAHAQTVAAMSVSVPTVRFNAVDQDRARRALTESAGRLSAALGYRPGGAASAGR